MPSRRAQILSTLVDRLEAIAVSGGFNTDAGAQVFLHTVPAMGDDDPDAAVSVVVNDEDVVWQQSGKAWQVGLPVEVQALVKATVATAGELLEALLDDVTAAIETEDRTLGGLVDFPLERGPVRSLPREAGSLSVGVAITYTAKFKEGWGHR